MRLPLLPLVIWLAACSQPVTAPVDSASDVAVEVVDTVDDTGCVYWTDTACCLNGAVYYTTCFGTDNGKLTCPGGGFACNMMGGASSQCAKTCGGDAVQPDVPDTVDTQGGTPTPYPAVAATLPVQLTNCDATFAFKSLAPELRPASQAPCFEPKLAPGAALTCLPWEWCDKEMHLEPFHPLSEATYSGSLQCMRPCEAKDGPCPDSTTCGPFSFVDGDVGMTIQVCSGSSGGPWPSYNKTIAPAEGGLGCWAQLAQLEVYVDATYVARVGPHVYALTVQAGIFGAEGYTSQARLWHAPLAAPSDATMTVVLDQPQTANEWTGLGAAGDRLVAFARKTPGMAMDTVWQTFSGVPQPSGAIELQPTPAELILTEPARVVPGTSDACVVSLQNGVPFMQCLRFTAQGAAQLLIPALKLPPDLLSRQACMKLKFNDAGYTLLRGMAVGGGRIAILMPPCETTDKALLSLASFNDTTDSVGAWQTWQLPVAVGGSPLLYKDTLLAAGWTARLDAAGAHAWLPSTMPHRSYLSPVVMADDVVVAFQPVSPTGPGLQTAQLWVNRVLW